MARGRTPGTTPYIPKLLDNPSFTNFQDILKVRELPELSGHPELLGDARTQSFTNFQYVLKVREASFTNFQDILKVREA